MLDRDPRLEWLRAYVAKSRQGSPFAPNVRRALIEMVDETTVANVSRLTGVPLRTLHGFLDQRRRVQAALRRAVRGKDDERAAMEQALADRDARLALLPATACIEIDLLGSPPPGRSALDQRRAREGR